MSYMIGYLREFHPLSVILRLLFSVIGGGMLGYGRARKQSNAGLRTYTLVSLGAALTMLISLYEYEMLNTNWQYLYAVADVKFDGTRYAAQVISGIGFLATGTILSIGHQQVTGLTTAIGLFTAGCIGIAAGAGFYEIVLAGIVLAFFAMEVLQPAEVSFKRRLRNITIYVEFENIGDVNTISDAIKSRGASIFDIDIERSKRENNLLPAAIITMKLGKEQSSHSAMLSSIAELECVSAVRELIS